MVYPFFTKFSPPNPAPVLITRHRQVLKRWSLTQSTSVYDQLVMGIRYLDIRIAPDPTTAPTAVNPTTPTTSDVNPTTPIVNPTAARTPRTLHALYGCLLSEVLSAVKRFLTEQPSEALLLDVNHVYAFTAAEHLDNQRLISSSLGDLLCPVLAAVPSLDALRRTPHRVICFYQYTTDATVPGVWPQRRCVSEWADTCQPDTLIAYLNRCVATPPCRERFRVLQGILTPDVAYLLRNMQRSLKECLAGPFTARFVRWMLRVVQSGRADNLTVMLADFVEMSDFIPVVIRLNDFKTGGPRHRSIY